MAILVATNLTENDHGARELAGAIAKRLGESIILAHVFEHTERSEASVHAALEYAIAEIERFGPVASHITLHGAPLTALMAYARRIDPKLVIIGKAHVANNRRGGFAKARTMLSRLDIPVLYASHVVPLMSSLVGSRRPRILAVLGDSRATDAAVLRTVRSLRRTIPSDCTFFCAGSGPQANEALRVRATSGEFDLVIAGARAHLTLIDDVVDDELPPILFVPPRHAVRIASRADVEAVSEAPHAP